MAGAGAEDPLVAHLGELTVTYTVRELLERIEERLVRMETRAEDVATKAAVESLAQKVDQLESVRDRMIGAAFAVGALAGGGAGWIANLLSG